MYIIGVVKYLLQTLFNEYHSNSLTMYFRFLLFSIPVIPIQQNTSYLKKISSNWLNMHPRFVLLKNKNNIFNQI